jgi:hypothetical protein
MSIPEGTPTLTTRSKIVLLLVFWLLLLAISAAGTELVLRRSPGGYEPWTPPPKADIDVNPGGRFFVKDPTLGYRQIAGAFAVTLGGEYTFRVTHLANGLRITHSLDDSDRPNKKEEIWIFGCSITHGWSLNDEETYPWLIQERFPEYEVVNFGVEGYGTIHSLLQFREALKHTRPKAAVLAYMSFHDERNTFLRKRRKAIGAWNRLGPLVQPYATLGANGQLHYSMATVEYREVPLMRTLALAHAIDQIYGDFEEWFYRSHDVSLALIEQMAMEAKDNGVTFAVASVGDDDLTRSTLRFLREHGTRTLDMAVDLRIKENTNEPYDPHPSALANRTYADRLERALRADYLR